MKSAVVVSVLALAVAALAAPTLSEAEEKLNLTPELSDEVSQRERKSLPLVAASGYGGSYGGIAAAPINVGYGHPVASYGQAAIGGYGHPTIGGYGHQAIGGYGHAGLGGYGQAGLAVGGYGASLGYGHPSIVLKGPSLNLGHYRENEDSEKSGDVKLVDANSQTKPQAKASEDKPEESINAEQPSARSYGGYGAAPIALATSAYGGSGCGITSPAIIGPSVGVFPNSNVGGCAVPLLLSCSPRVSSGYVVKQHYGGHSYGGAYRASEDSNQTEDSSSAKQGQEQKQQTPKKESKNKKQ